MKYYTTRQYTINYLYFIFYRPLSKKNQKNLKHAIKIVIYMKVIAGLKCISLQILILFLFYILLVFKFIYIYILYRIRNRILDIRVCCTVTNQS